MPPGTLVCRTNWRRDSKCSSTTLMAELSKGLRRTFSRCDAARLGTVSRPHGLSGRAGNGLSPDPTTAQCSLPMRRSHGFALDGSHRTRPIRTKRAGETFGFNFELDDLH